MNNEFQYRLLKSIADKRISASELSRETGIDKAALSNYINGKYVPKQDKCYLIARALDVDPGWLMTGDEPTTRDLIAAEFIKEEERELVIKWRQADLPIRSAVKKLLDMK
jgi:transcriptional regulator with XRE-family HTH domain